MFKVTGRDYRLLMARKTSNVFVIKNKTEATDLEVFQMASEVIKMGFMSNELPRYEYGLRFENGIVVEFIEAEYGYNISVDYITEE